MPDPVGPRSRTTGQKLRCVYVGDAADVERTARREANVIQSSARNARHPPTAAIPEPGWSGASIAWLTSSALITVCCSASAIPCSPVEP